MTDTISCPNCGAEFDVSETLTVAIRERLQAEVERDARRKERELTDRFDQQRDALRAEAAGKAKEAVALELQDLHDQLHQANAKVDEAQKAELHLRKERRQLETQKQELELAVTRTLDEERAKIRDDAKRQADDDNRLHLADKEKLIGDLLKQIDDLRRVSEQGTAQSRGEAMELLLEDWLRDVFPHDTIEPVPTSFPSYWASLGSMTSARRTLRRDKVPTSSLAICRE